MNAVIMGAGFIADFHAAAYTSLSETRLRAICDTDAEKAKAAAEKWGCAWYTDGAEMLKKEKPDLVSVCLPTFLHEQYTLLSLKAGAHVLCEKPLALTLEECRRMRKAAEEAGKMLMTGQVLRWWPEYAAMKKEMDRLGRPRFIETHRMQHPTRIIWHMQPQLGGGALFDLLVHDLDYVCALLGTDAEVLSATGIRGMEGSWRQVCAHLRWPDGCAAQLTVSSLMPQGYPFTADFRAEYESACLDYRFTTAGNIRRGAAAQTDFLLYENGKIQELPLAQDAQSRAFLEEITAFVRGVQTGKNPLPVSETMGVMNLVHKIKSELEK